MAHGKNYRNAKSLFDREREYSPAEAIRLIKEAAGIDKGSGEPHSEKVGSITVDQARQIAERKMPDLNANDIDAATKIIAGTARSMGVTVEGLES